MPNNTLHFLGVPDIVEMKYERWPSRVAKLVPTRFFKNLDRESTYVNIFSQVQTTKLNFFKEQKRVKILFETPWAINPRYSNTEPRTKLVVWEFVKDDDKAA